MSSVSIVSTRYPYFEDMTSSSEVRFSSNDLEETYKLFEKTEERKGKEELVRETSTNREELIIEKFNKNPELSTRYFRIISSSVEASHKTTFYYRAFITGAEKVVDWFIARFPFQKQFALGLGSVVRDFPDNKVNARMVAKITATCEIRKKCASSLYQKIGEGVFPMNPLTLSKKEMDHLLAAKPSVFLTDRVFSNGEDVTGSTLSLISEVIISGKNLMFEAMLETCTKKEIMTEISNCSPIPFMVASIIHDYVPSFITQKGHDFLTLIVSIPQPSAECHLTWTSFKQTLRAMVKITNLDQQKRILKIAKLLLNYDEGFPELPHFIDNNGPSSIRDQIIPFLPSNFIEHIKEADESENSLQSLVEEFENFYKEPKNIKDRHVLQEICQF